MEAPAVPVAPAAPTTTTPAPVAQNALDLIPAQLINANGESVSKESLKGKFVGIYFSAHWCGPCRRFTPLLVEFRNAHAAEFEVVFISSDKSAEAMKGYMTESKMQWPAVAFDDPVLKVIKKHFAVRGIPTLIILGPDGQVVSNNGRAQVTRLKDAALEAWKKPRPQAVQ